MVQNDGKYKWLVRVSLRNYLHRPSKNDQDFHYAPLSVVCFRGSPRVFLLLTSVQILNDIVASLDSSLNGPCRFGRPEGSPPIRGILTVELAPEVTRVHSMRQSFLTSRCANPSTVYAVAGLTKPSSDCSLSSRNLTGHLHCGKTPETKNHP